MSEQYAGEDLDHSLEAPAMAQYDTAAPSAAVASGPASLLHFNRQAFIWVVIIVAILFATATTVYLLTSPASHTASNGGSSTDRSVNFKVGPISLNGIRESTLQLSQANHLAINGQLTVNNGIVLNPSSAPTTGVAGQLYYDQNTNKPYYYNGTQFVSLSPSPLQSVATLGNLTGLTTTGNTGAGSTPTLAVTYGSTANTAAQGNTTFVCPTGTGNLTGGGTTITIGAGGTCSGLTVINNPTFTGLVTANGGLSVGSTTVLGKANFTDGTVDGFAGTIQLAGAITANQTYSLPTTGGTFCLSTNNCNNQAAGNYELTTGTDFIRNQTTLQTTANFNIQSAAAASVGGIIQGAVSQTADLLQIQNSAGTILAKIDANGNIQTSGQLMSQVATGTAPLTVASTTLVTNLNADMVDGLHASSFALTTDSTNFIRNQTTLQTGNFNIQSAAAASVSGVIRAAASQTADLLQLQNSAGTVLSKFDASGNLVVSSTGNSSFAGNVGIGTTTPTQKLDIQGGNIQTSGQLMSTVATGTAPLSVASTTLVTNLNADMIDGLHASAFAPASGSGNYIQNTTVQQAGANFNISGSGTIGTILTVQGAGSSSFAGNVGIGVTSPTSVLTVKAVSDTAPTLSLLYPSGTVALEVRTGGLGNYSTYIGLSSGSSNTTGYDNTANGAYALQANTTGYDNTANGYGTLNSNTTGYQNTSSGSLTLNSNTTGKQNTASGAYALVNNTTGANNTALGFQAGTTSVAANANTTGSGNTFIGFNSGPGVASASSLQNATAIGNQATVNTSNSLVLGSIAGINGATSSTNVGIGTASPTSVLTVKAVSDTAATLSLLNPNGTAALEVRTGGAGNHNTYIGLNSGMNNYIGYSNTTTGAYALQNNSNGYQNTASGYSALYSNTTGSNNAASGFNALYNNTIGTQNTANGFAALRLNTTGSNNTASGNGALYANTTGSNNTALGFQAGFQDSAGNFATVATLQNATAIGAYAQVQASNSIVLGSIDTPTSVGIGTTIPLNTFSVSPLDYATGTASQSLTTVTGTGTTWTAAMVGEQFIFANGSTGTITGFTSSTSLTLSTSQTVAAQAYRIHHIGLQVTSGGSVGIGTTTPGKNLDVVGEMRVQNGSYPKYHLDATGNGVDLKKWQTYVGPSGDYKVAALNDAETIESGYMVLTRGGSLNVQTGYQIAGAAAAGSFLRGNGTNFVSSTIQAADIPAGSGNYIQNTTTQQSPANFNINGSGTLSGNVAIIMAAPSTLTTSTATTGGTLAAATYYYKVTALDGAGGETTASSEASIATTGTTSTVTISWTAIQGAASYKVYRGTTAGGENTYYTSSATSFTDTGTAGTAGTVPTATTAYLNKISASGNGSSWLNGGNVGIGTSTPGQLLDVQGGNIRASGEIISTLATGGFGQFRAVNGGYGTIFRQDSSDFYLLTTALNDPYGGWSALRPLQINNSTGNVTLGSNALFVQNAGNVGIGTSAPAYKLDVQGGSINTSGFARVGSSVLLLQNSSGLSDITNNSIDGAFNIYTDSGNSNNLTIAEKGGAGVGVATARLVVTHAGNVGVGTTTPAYLLDVAGTGQFSNNILIGGGVSQGLYGDNTNLAIRGYNVANAGFYVQANAGSTTPLYVGLTGTYANRVGVNTQTPGTSLDVQGTANVSGVLNVTQIQAQNTVGDKISLWGALGGANYGFGIQASLLQIHSDTVGSDIAFGYGSSAAFTENMRIKGNGTVGIGTAAPNGKLQVVSASATMVGLIVQAAASPTADILQIQDSTGAVLARVTPTGYFSGANLTPTDFTVSCSKQTNLGLDPSSFARYTRISPSLVSVNVEFIASVTDAGNWRLNCTGLPTPRNNNISLPASMRIGGTYYNFIMVYDSGLWWPLANGQTVAVGYTGGISAGDVLYVNGTYEQ